MSEHQWQTGGHPSTTNNLMELRAIFDALAAEPPARPLLIESDSQCAIKSLTVWLDGRERNGWRTSAKKPVRNPDAIEAIDGLPQGRDAKWCQVKGHDGHVLDELCDLRAGNAAAATRDGSVVDAGPGLHEEPVGS